jgi:hypothetical protein
VPPADDPLAPGFGDEGADRAARRLSELPGPDDAGVDLERLRSLAVERGIPGYSPAADAAEVRRVYGEWYRGTQFELLQRTLDPLERAGFTIEDPATPRVGVDALTRILTRILLPPLFEPFRSPHPHVALRVSIAQVWEPKGYTRGDLVNTISLAPGEQLTLEFHSWDKTTYKSEKELIQEQELRVTETSTERDVLTVSRETATKFNAHLDAHTRIKIKTVPVNLDGGAATETATKVGRTLEQTREHTVEAAQTLKMTRKLRIEVTREVGREQKQTRVIANTNRCHSLNCLYFEVMANYVVTTRVTAVEPVLLLVRPRPGVTPAWVLCHEAVLKSVLLDGVFLPGFDGARVLETHDAFLEAKKAEAKARGEIASQYQQEVKGLLKAIVDAYDRVRGSARSVRKHARSWDCKMAKRLGGSLALAVCVSVHAGLPALRRLLYGAMLYGNETALNALRKLSDARETDNPGSALRDFLAVVSPRDFQFNPATAAIAKGLDALGVPGGLVNALLGWGLLDLVADDGGLSNAVAAASSRLDQLWGLPPSDKPQPKEGYATMEVAQARVAFDQLRCHIDDNWLHYAQAMWLAEHQDERFLRLQSYGTVAAVLDDEVRGFLGHKSAYRLLDPQVIKAIDLAHVAESAKARLDASLPAPYLVTVPTPGTVLEAMVGQCDACEDFIQQSRVFDLRTQEAKARGEEAEARRRELRLDATPPDLSAFDGMQGNQVTVTVAPPPTPTP